MGIEPPDEDLLQGGEELPLLLVVLPALLHRNVGVRSSRLVATLLSPPPLFRHMPHYECENAGADDRRIAQQIGLSRRSQNGW